MSRFAGNAVQSNHAIRVTMLCFVRDSRTSALNTAMLCRPACCERDRRSPHALPFPGDAVDISWVSENETCLEDSEGRTLGRWNGCQTLESLMLVTSETSMG